MPRNVKDDEIKKREKLRSEGNESQRLLNEIANLLLSDDYSDVECD